MISQVQEAPSRLEELRSEGRAWEEVQEAPNRLEELRSEDRAWEEVFPVGWLSPPPSD